MMDTGRMSQGVSRNTDFGLKSMPAAATPVARGQAIASATMNTVFGGGLAKEGRLARAEAIRNRSVVIKMDTRGKPYDRFMMAEALSKLISLKFVEWFGPLQRNAEWICTLTAEVHVQMLTSVGELVVEVGPNNSYRGTIVSAGVRDVKLRIHWLPPWFDDDILTKELDSRGLKVVKIQIDHSNVKLNSGQDLKHIKIPVRSVSVKLDSKDTEIPHILNLFDDVYEESHRALVTVIGRKPICLRCNLQGHMRHECSTPYCHECKVWGHQPGTCPTGYAAAAAVRSPAPLAENEIDMDQNSEDLLESPSQGRNRNMSVSCSDAEELVRPLHISETPRSPHQDEIDSSGGVSVGVSSQKSGLQLTQAQRTTSTPESSYLSKNRFACLDSLRPVDLSFASKKRDLPNQNEPKSSPVVDKKKVKKQKKKKLNSNDPASLTQLLAGSDEDS